jgi:hypothetical protein
MYDSVQKPPMHTDKLRYFITQTDRPGHTRAKHVGYEPQIAWISRQWGCEFCESVKSAKSVVFSGGSGAMRGGPAPSVSLSSKVCFFFRSLEVLAGQSKAALMEAHGLLGECF